MFKSITLTTILLAAGGLVSLPVFADTAAQASDDTSLGEHAHPRYLHNRLDVNDDGQIGPRERAHAQALKSRADHNQDGKIGPRERHHAHHVLNRVDRRH
jgi:hypothetical protein